MAVSQNGYPANDPSVLSSFTVAGRTFRVRRGPCLEVLRYVVEQFNARVEPLIMPDEQMDDWSYAERPIRGGTALSNHASGTAVDLNATRHPLGTEPSANFTERQQDEIRRILNETSNVVRWGGHYTGRKDPMHFEINATESAVAAIAARLPREELSVADAASLTKQIADLKELVSQVIRGTATDARAGEYSAEAISEETRPANLVSLRSRMAGLDKQNKAIIALLERIATKLGA